MRTATEDGHRRITAAKIAAVLAVVLLSACAGWPPGPVPGSEAPPAATAPGSAAASAAASARPASSATASVPDPAATPTVPPAPPARDPSPSPAAGNNGPEPASIETAARAFYAYFERVRLMSPGELGREFVRLDQPGNPTNVLELALALGQTRNPSDTVRALGVLDPLVKSADPQHAPWRPLARLLWARYTEQRRLEEQVERQNQQLRDAQRRQEQLAQQLEALKAIERSLTNRPAAPPASPTNRPPTP